MTQHTVGRAVKACRMVATLVPVDSGDSAMNNNSWPNLNIDSSDDPQEEDNPQDHFWPHLGFHDESEIHHLQYHYQASFPSGGQLLADARILSCEELQNDSIAQAYPNQGNSPPSFEDEDSKPSPYDEEDRKLPPHHDSTPQSYQKRHSLSSDPFDTDDDGTMRHLYQGARENWRPAYDSASAYPYAASYVHAPLSSPHYHQYHCPPAPPSHLHSPLVPAAHATQHPSLHPSQVVYHLGGDRRSVPGESSQQTSHHHPSTPANPHMRPSQKPSGKPLPIVKSRSRKTAKKIVVRAPVMGNKRRPSSLPCGQRKGEGSSQYHRSPSVEELNLCKTRRAKVALKSWYDRLSELYQYKGA